MSWKLWLIFTQYEFRLR